MGMTLTMIMTVTARNLSKKTAIVKYFKHFILFQTFLLVLKTAVLRLQYNHVNIASIKPLIF